MCSIAYEQCDERSFRIGPSRQATPYQSQLYPNFPVAANAYPSPYQSNQYYPNPALNNPIITSNGMIIQNPYASPNGIITPNRIIYDANGFPLAVSPNGMLTPINPNALAGK